MDKNYKLLEERFEDLELALNCEPIPGDLAKKIYELNERKFEETKNLSLEIKSGSTFYSLL